MSASGPHRRRRSAAYLEVGPLFLQGLVDLLDHADQQREFQRLERRARQGGSDVVDHPKNGHDDYANSFALAATMLIAKGAQPQYRVWRPDMNAGFSDRIRESVKAEPLADYETAVREVSES
jgi:hypothetical protein